MTGIKFLLDTNIVIALLKQGQSLLLDSHITPDVCAISQITRMELLSFFQLSVEEEQVIKKFVASVTVIGISEAVETATINFRRSHSSKLPDAIITATALTYHLELITLDERMKSAYLVAKSTWK